MDVERKAVWNSMLLQQESQDLPICVLQKMRKPSTLRNVAEMSAKEVFDAVKAGDEVAIEIATEFGKYLGHALANLAAACDPAVIVIGGGVSKAGEVLLDYIKGPFKRNGILCRQRYRICTRRTCK